MTTQVLLGMLLGAGPLGALVTLIKWRQEGKVPQAQAAKTSAEAEAILEEKLWERTQGMLDRMEKENQRDRERMSKEIDELRVQVDNLREALVQERALHQADAFDLNNQRRRVGELEAGMAVMEDKYAKAKAERDAVLARYEQHIKDCAK